MNTDGLVLGLLDNSAEIGDVPLAVKYRDLTISWSRFGYRDLIIEGTDVDAILGESLRQGFRFCLVQPYGHVIQERWTPDNWQARDFYAALNASIQNTDFLVMGQMADAGADWFGFQPGCLLVNLEQYQQLGCPSFASGDGAAVALPEAVPVTEQGRWTALRRGATTVVRRPRRPGWQWIRASLLAGLPVMEISDEVRHYSLQLPTQPQERSAVVQFLGAGIERFEKDDGLVQLDAGQRDFLRPSMLRRRTLAAVFFFGTSNPTGMSSRLRGIFGHRFLRCTASPPASSRIASCTRWASVSIRGSCTLITAPTP